MCVMKSGLSKAQTEMLSQLKTKKQQYGNKNSYHNSKNVISDYLPLHAIFAKKKSKKSAWLVKKFANACIFSLASFAH